MTPEEFGDAIEAEAHRAADELMARNQGDERHKLIGAFLDGAAFMYNESAELLAPIADQVGERLPQIPRVTR